MSYLKTAATLKNILLYVLMPEDTTAGTGSGYNSHRLFKPSRRNLRLGLLKAVFWTIMAVAAPVLLCHLPG